MPSLSSRASVDVLGVGWLLQDVVMLLPGYPDEDTKSEALRTFVQVGGPVPRALSALARLGVRTELAAVAGRDEPGRTALETLADRGVGTRPSLAAEGATRRSQVWVNVENGSRTIAYSAEELPPLPPSPEALEAAAGASVIHLDGRELDTAREVVAAARRGRGEARVVLDAGGWKPDLESLLPDVTVLVASAATLRNLEPGSPDDVAKRLVGDLGAGAVLVTHGSRGTDIVHAGAVEHVPACEVDAVDTNGAGDIFSAGVSFGLLREMSLVDATRFASALSAASCRQLGDYFPPDDEVTALLAGG
jgi:sulfofructose kinase